MLDWIYGISLLVFNSTSYSLVRYRGELSKRIPYLRAPMYYSL